jgi:hypothetical protein
MAVVFSDNHNRTYRKHYLFTPLVNYEVMKLDRNKVHLEFSEVYEFFIQSWVYCFKFLQQFIENRCKEEFVKSEYYVPKDNQLEIVIPGHEAEVKGYLTAHFGEKTTQIDFELFKKFYEQDHTLEIIYYNKRIRMAMSLACLDDIEILYDMRQEVVATAPQLNNVRVANNAKVVK